MAGISSFADRFNIQNNNQWPKINISAQQVLYCLGGGSCEGGSLNSVYKFAHAHFLVDQGCKIYEAFSPAEKQCEAIHNCQSCWPAGCRSEDRYRKYRSTEYGRVSGVLAMKKEIYARGPITCSMHVTKRLYSEYKSGVWSEEVEDRTPNQAVAVVGW